MKIQTVVKRKPDGTLVALVVSHRPRNFPTKHEIALRGEIYRCAGKRGLVAAAKRFKCSTSHVRDVLDWYEHYLSTH